MWELDDVANREARSSVSVWAVIAVVSLPDLFAHHEVVCDVVEVYLTKKAAHNSVAACVCPSKAAVEVGPECVCRHCIISVCVKYIYRAAGAARSTRWALFVKTFCAQKVQIVKETILETTPGDAACLEQHRLRRVALGAVTATVHLLHRAGERQITPEDIAHALGSDPLNAPIAPPVGAVTHVEHRLWRIGEQAGRSTKCSPDHKTVLLGFTPDDRPLHFIVVQPWSDGGKKKARPELVTLWDPSSEDNREFWQDDFAGPTKPGQYKVPRTVWHRPPSNK